jgi:hypothetical protein
MTYIDELIEQFGSRQALWKHLFEYRDGALYWKNPRAPRMKPGDRAGQFNARYWSCNVCSKRVYIHRIIFEMYNGDTALEVDHIDRDTNNNRLENLRAVSRAENVANTGIRSDNLSGYKGVSFHKATGKWIAQPVVDGKRKWLGGFATAAEAGLAYNDVTKEK